MVRVLLAACLTIQSVFGPTLCCCTFASVPKVNIESKASRTEAKCPYCQQQNDEPANCSQEQSDTPYPTRHPPCPCHKRPADVFVKGTAASPTDELSPFQRAVTNWLHASFSNATFDTAGPHFDPIGGNDLPFLTAQELLRTHHVLRC